MDEGERERLSDREGVGAGASVSEDDAEDVFARAIMKGASRRKQGERNRLAGAEQPALMG